MTGGESPPAPETPSLMASIAERLAVSYLERGWVPIPLKPGGKVALIKWERYQKERPTYEDVHDWWDKWPDANIGIITGALSGLAVVDLDTDEALRNLGERCGGLMPSTLMVKTPRGFHLYFAHPGLGVNVPTKAALLPGTDLRGDGGYVVAPGSIGEDGQRYRVLLNAELAPLPEWLPPLLAKSTEAAQKPTDRPSRLRQGVLEGQRNTEAARLAGIYVDMGLEEEEVLTLLRRWNEHNRPPLEDEELQTVVRSIVKTDNRNHPERRIAQTEFVSLVPPKGVSGKETNFHPLSAADLLATEEEEITWVWELFIPEGGLVLLTAFMKEGKSTFTYALSLAVSQGRPFLGYPTKQGGVLILAVEEHPRDVTRRLRRFGMTTSDPVYVHAATLDRANLESVKKFIRDKEITLVLLDTLSRFWKVKDENSNAEIMREVSPLLDLARETGAAVLLVHHERKSGGEDGRGIRGGSALFGLADQALILKKREGGQRTHRVLSCHGQYDETPSDLVFELKDDEYHLLGTPETLSKGEDKRKVLEAVTREPQDVPTLAKKAGLPEKRVREILADPGEQVIREGKGVKGDPHTYRLADNSILPYSHPIGGKETNPRYLATEGDDDLSLALREDR